MTPVILGTVAGQTVAAGSTIDPFSSMVITDPNNYPGAEKLDANQLTISLLDQNGNPTDANGSLSLSGDPMGETLSKTSPGVYVLSQQEGPNLTVGLFQAAPQLQFIPASAATTTFQLAATDVYNETGIDSTTTVTAGGASAATPVPAPTTPPINLAELTLTSGGSLTDSIGNLWTLTSGGDVDQNGTPVAGGGGTSALTIVNDTIYGQDNGSNGGGWFTYSAASHFWTPAAAPS